MLLKNLNQMLNKLVGAHDETAQNVDNPSATALDLSKPLIQDPIDNFDDLNEPTSNLTQTTLVLQQTDDDQTENDDDDDDEFIDATATNYSSSQQRDDEITDKPRGRWLDAQKRLRSSERLLGEEIRLNLLLSKECVVAKETIEKLLEKNIKLETELVQMRDETLKFEARKNEEIAALRRNQAVRNKEIASLKDCIDHLEQRIEMFSRIVQASIQVVEITFFFSGILT